MEHAIPSRLALVSIRIFCKLTWSCDKRQFCFLQPVENCRCVHSKEKMESQILNDYQKLGNQDSILWTRAIGSAQIVSPWEGTKVTVDHHSMGNGGSFC